MDTSNRTLILAGMGIVFYSPGNTKHINVGSDYLSHNLWSPRDVERHVSEGSIVAVNVGSPGEYLVQFCVGYPSQQFIEAAATTIRLPLSIVGGKICVDDLFSFSNWEGSDMALVQLACEDGNYHVTLSTSLPNSGFLGDKQVIHVFLQKLDDLPETTIRGVPQLIADRKTE